MIRQCHILNGDSLKSQFPKDIKGQIIVARECLVDGEVNGDTLEDLIETRAEFISNNYPGYKKGDYYYKTVPELRKIQEIEKDSEVNLWFEDDLFCQVNFWFVVNLLAKSGKTNKIFLIRPLQHNQYGFGGLNETQLLQIYKERQPLDNVEKLSELWEYYRGNDLKKLYSIAKSLEETYPFIPSAVQLHIERIPDKDNFGRPVNSLLKIMDELKTKEFAPVFKEFCKRENGYGFGDLQVRRLFDEIIHRK